MACGRIVIGTTDIGLNSKYNQYFGNPGTSNISWTATRALTYPVQAQNNSSWGNYNGASNYFFWVHTYNTQSSKGSTGISWPFTQGPGSNLEYGQDNQAVSSTYTYITITASPYPPNTFTGWYNASTGGTLRSALSSYNVAYDSTPVTSGEILYARWA